MNRDEPSCPHCGLQANLKGKQVPVVGLSYATYLIWCAECGAIVGKLWHPEMLRNYAERTVDMIMEALTTPAIAEILECVEADAATVAAQAGEARQRAS